MGKSDKEISRRKLLKTLGIGSLGAAMLAYQNCSPEPFNIPGKNNSSSEPDPLGTPAPDCIRNGQVADSPICEAGTFKINGQEVLTQSNPGNLAAVALEHTIRIKFYQVLYFDQDTKNLQPKDIFTVGVGPNPDFAIYHPVANGSLSQENKLTDIYVFDASSCELLRWHRLSSSSQKPFVMMVADPLWAVQGRQVKVVVRDALHGYWGEDFTFSPATASAYGSAVATYVNTVPYGGSSLDLPYIGDSAAGGQTPLGQAHAPHIRRINDSLVEVTQGDVDMRHPRVDTSHYINGCALYDQHGQLIAQSDYSGIARTNNHLFRFDNLNLSSRGIRELRAVTFDTFNGYLMGFKSLV